jgi:hypothetical protein
MLRRNKSSVYLHKLVLHIRYPLSLSYFFLISWGWGETESTRYVDPLIGLLYELRMIDLVEWELTEETEILEENLPQCHSVQPISIQ